MKATTKLQYNNRHHSTTFPSIFANALNAKAGDIVNWELDTNEEVITIKLMKVD